MFLLLLTLYGGEWVETTQEDFADGWFSRDLYASHCGDGALEFVGRYDLNNDGYIDIPGCGWILWGSSSGYSTGNKTECMGGGGCDAADLNNDGYPEFLTTQMSDPIRIFWGTPSGPDVSNPLELECYNYNNEGVFIADFNNDGYLDLLASVDDNNAGIFWGSRGSYSSSDVTLLPCFKAGFNPEAADLNKDGWLDVIVITGDTYDKDEQFIYWGSPNGFSAGNRTKVLYGKGGPHGMSVADINRDGWLDLVYSGNIPDTAAILWGSEDVYKSGQAVQVDLYLDLSHHCFGGSGVADLDSDGYLDVVFFGNDGVPPRIYWGGPDAISPDRYTDLPDCPSVGSGGFVADFNADGSLDIFEYGHGGGSLLFYGPDFSNCLQFDLASHHGFSREIGNVYTRGYREEYYSSIYDTEMDVGYIELSWEDSCPGESRVSFAVRTGEKPDTTNEWGMWAPVENGESIVKPDEFHSIHHYIQYKAIFIYTNPAELPVLKEVHIKYEEAEGIEEDQNSPIPPELTVTPTHLYSEWSIRFSTSASGPVDLAIYEISGSRVRTLMKENVSAGPLSLVWDGCDDHGALLPQGVYFVRLRTLGDAKTAKLVLIR